MEQQQFKNTSPKSGGGLANAINTPYGYCLRLACSNLAGNKARINATMNESDSSICDAAHSNGFLSPNNFEGLTLQPLSFKILA
jgi:hypothetical protein